MHRLRPRVLCLSAFAAAQEIELAALSPVTTAGDALVAFTAWFLL